MVLPMPCKENRDEVSAAPCRASYVHGPFCQPKCRYRGSFCVGRITSELPLVGETIAADVLAEV